MEVGALCGRRAHGPSPNCVSSRGCDGQGLGPIVIASLLQPLGGSGSEEGNQPSPEANLWDKAHC